jgi:glycosyltransferase involved in cell wall biosynthesis
MPGPEVSVVCATHQRAARLPGLFAALEAQTFDPTRFEVVFVDDGSKDNTVDVLEKLIARTHLRVRLISLEKNGGAGAARNAGWQAANAPIVAFTDDDCAPDPNWLRAGMAALEQTGAAVVVGRTEPNPAQKQNEGAFSRTQRVTEASGKRYLHTCNIFYRRADLEAVGGFSPRFRTKGGEDTDLGWRVLDLGGGVTFANDALVLHDITVGSYRAALREASRWRDVTLVVARHPARARPLLIHRLFWKKTHELVIVAAGGAALAVLVRNPIPLVLMVPWIRWRVTKWPIVPERVGAVAYLPGAFLIDVVEVFTMVRGSLRNRTVVL